MSQEPMNNFTPRAQQVLALARKEADRFHHNYVGTEHILLGLIKLGQGVAVSVLQKMGLDLETVRSAVEKQVGTGQETKTPGSIPYTPRVKKVLALAGKEAKTLSHSYVGTEHILLGLLREGEGVAARVLKSLEIDIERTRNEILRELDPQFSGRGSGDAGTPAKKRPPAPPSAPPGPQTTKKKSRLLRSKPSVETSLNGPPKERGIPSSAAKTRSAASFRSFAVARKTAPYSSVKLA